MADSKNRAGARADLSRRGAQLKRIGRRALPQPCRARQWQRPSPWPQLPRKKSWKLTYWNWADNPVHQKISVDAVEMFNKLENFIEVEVDATMAVMESRKKLVTLFAAGAAPDVANMVQYWAQDYYDNDILHPIEDYFKKWDAAPIFFPT